MIITNPAGCSDTVNKEIKDGLMGFAIKGMLEFCEGQTTKLAAPLTGNAFKYLWNTGEKTESIEVNKSGTYWLEIIDNLGCKGWDTVEVKVFPKITAGIFPNGNQLYICEGDSIKLTAQPFESGTSYLWSTGEATPEIFVSKDGEYSVKVTSMNGCSDSAKVNVIINPKPVVKIIGNSVICENETAELSADKDYSTYLWSTNENSKSISIQNEGLYWLKVTNEFGCTDSTSITIKTTPKPKAEIEIQASNPLCEGETAILSSKTENQNYIWSTGEQSKSISIQNSGYYSLKVLNEFGCSDTVGTFLSFQPNIIFRVDTLNTTPGNDKQGLKIRGKYNKEVPLTLNQVDLLISFDKTCFYPNESQLFKIFENKIENDNRIYGIRLENVNLTNEVSTIAEIKGLALLGNNQGNKIMLEDIQIPDKNYCLEKIDGYLMLDSVCVYNLRRIIFSNQEILSLSPNPASTELNLEMLNGEKIQSISVFNILGKNQLMQENIDSKETKLDTSNLPNGKYILEIRTKKEKYTESFMIVR